MDLQYVRKTKKSNGSRSMDLEYIQVRFCVHAVTEEEKNDFGIGLEEDFVALGFRIRCGIGFEENFAKFQENGIDGIYCMSVNDSFVMNKWAEAQDVKNVNVIPDGSGEFTRKVGMLVRKDSLGFGLRSWRYAAIINDGVVEAWFEEPGLEDNHGEDPYGESSPENVLKYLEAANTEVAA